MISNEESDNNSKFRSSVLIFIVSFLLLASIAVSVVGLMNGKNKEKAESDQEVLLAENHQEEEPLTELFDKEFSQQSNSGQDSLYNPFKEFCGDKGSDGAPSISSYTVCFN